ncbi:MAG: hypothetical protein NUW01_13645 [Gemmatimonadaceae bacterium]|nr:hypothetical protein [Gemmatimonadaceae bacterium]
MSRRTYAIVRNNESEPCSTVSGMDRRDALVRFLNEAHLTGAGVTQHAHGRSYIIEHGGDVYRAFAA